jgi:four helix bundle protein
MTHLAKPTISSAATGAHEAVCAARNEVCRTLDDKPGEGWVIRNQVLRSGTAVAANYRAACRARSVAEFAAKIGVVVEECDETIFWFELLIEGHVVPQRACSRCSTKVRNCCASLRLHAKRPAYGPKLELCNDCCLSLKLVFQSSSAKTRRLELKTQNSKLKI